MNFIVNNENLLETDMELFFEDDPVVILDKNSDMLDVLVSAGIFSSKSQARKNWKHCGAFAEIASKDPPSFDIPIGFSKFPRLGKMKIDICILNPR